MIKKTKNITGLPYLLFYFTMVWIIFPQLPMLQRLSIVVFIHQVVSLFVAVGESIPIRSLMGTLFCLQLLIGPIIAYNGGDDYVLDVYKMRVEADDYFGYVLPATVCFLIGLNILGKNKGEVLDVEGIKEVARRNANIPYYLIVTGFVGGMIETIVPEELKFVFYLLACLKYIGVFITVFANDKIKFWPIVLVYGYLLGTSLSTGMFHDFLTWSIFLGAIFLLKFRIKALPKLAFFSGFFISALFIQFIKMDFRESLFQGASASVETVSDVYKSSTMEKGSMFSKENLYENSLRINQGYIVSNVIHNVPDNEPYSGGESMKQILFSAIFPRFLYRDKLRAGDQQIFKKFTGLELSRNTSMGLSSVGDAYANFGKEGGWVFMLFYGLAYNLVLMLLHKRGSKLPLLLMFTPVIFIYPIRPDCELQTILGHLIKSLFVVLLIFHWFRGKLQKT